MCLEKSSSWAWSAAASATASRNSALLPARKRCHPVVHALFSSHKSVAARDAHSAEDWRRHALFMARPSKDPSMTEWARVSPASWTCLTLDRRQRHRLERHPCLGSCRLHVHQVGSRVACGLPDSLQLQKFSPGTSLRTLVLCTQRRHFSKSPAPSFTFWKPRSLSLQPQRQRRGLKSSDAVCLSGNNNSPECAHHIAEACVQSEHCGERVSAAAHCSFFLA